MKQLFLLLIVFVFVPGVQSQSWVKGVGSGYDIMDGIRIAATPTGEVYEAGTFGGIVDFDPGIGTYTLNGNITSAYIVKLDAAGNFIWAKILDQEVLIDALATDSSGNLLVAGEFYNTRDFDLGPGVFSLTSNGQQDVFILKLDVNGNFLWAKSMGGPDYDRVITFSNPVNNSFFITGYFDTSADLDPNPLVNQPFSSAGLSDIFITKMDLNGNTLWTSRLGGTLNEVGVSVTTTSLGNTYLAGAFCSPVVDFNPGIGTYTLASANGITAGFAVFVLKLNNANNFIWAKRLGSSTGQIGVRSVVADSLENVYLSGNFNGTCDVNPGFPVYNITAGSSLNNFYTAKLDSAGNFGWAGSMPSPGVSFVDGMVRDLAGNLCLTGCFRNTIDFDPGPGQWISSVNGSSTTANPFLIKLSSSGVLLDVKHMKSQFESRAQDICTDGSGNIYLTGFYADTCYFDFGWGPYPLTSTGSYPYAFIYKQSSTPPVPLGLASGQTASRPQVYPNPVTHRLYIKMPGQLSAAKAAIYNSAGELTATMPLDENSSIDLGAYSSGLYLLQLTDGNGLCARSAESGERVKDVVKVVGH